MVSVPLLLLVSPTKPPCSSPFFLLLACPRGTPVKQMGFLLHLSKRSLWGVLTVNPLQSFPLIVSIAPSLLRTKNYYIKQISHWIYNMRRKVPFHFVNLISSKQCALLWKLREFVPRDLAFQFPLYSDSNLSMLSFSTLLNVETLSFLCLLRMT